MTWRPSKHALMTAAAVIAAAALLSYAVLTRSDGPAAPVAVLPGAPSLSDASPSPAPRSQASPASPTFPSSWNGKLVPASPTPTPREKMWRLEGVVVDVRGDPVKDVCVAIGPHGCQETSPRSDANGVYWVDLPQADVVFDLHFFKDGFPTVDRSIHPFGNIRLDVLLVPQS